jgi:hypothetical protein
MSHRSNSLVRLGGLMSVAVVALGALLAVGSAQAATLPTLTLALTKTSITVAGATQSGAVNVVTTATGTKEASAILFLMKPGATISEVETYLASKHEKDPNYASKWGSIAFDEEATPGTAEEAQIVLQPGQYLALSGEGEGTVKLRASFTVTASPSPAALPAAQATEQAIDFAFRGPSTLHDGELVRFENEGFLVHMDFVFPAKSGKAAKEIVKALLTGKEKGLEKLVAGPPVAFTGPVSHEAFQQETITAKPGIYVQACFMDTQDGRSHTRLGMERIIKIVK